MKPILYISEITLLKNHSRMPEYLTPLLINPGFVNIKVEINLEGDGDFSEYVKNNKVDGNLLVKGICDEKIKIKAIR